MHTTRVCRLHGKHDIRIETETVAPVGAQQVLVAIAAGGICGSDLHYYQDGGFGPIRVREPIVLGHEIAGEVLEVGADVHSHLPGDKVALNPSRPCHDCRFCREGLYNHCLSMRFYGSALRYPHEQGAFRDLIVVDAWQCETVNAATLAEAACSEPLAVCLHAGQRAGTLKDRRVLVTGAGPIGSLCVAVAKHAGASEIVVTDLEATTLAVAERMGASRCINVAEEPAAMEIYAEDKGCFDTVFECSAAEPAIRTAIASVRPRGTLVLVGVTGDRPLPINQIVGKEIDLRGTHRFHEEFAEAARLIDTRAIDVRPIITGTWPLEYADDAFSAAGDRSRSVKVQLSFAG